LYDWFILREILHVDLFKEKNKFWETYYMLICTERKITCKNQKS
jgi:hypothetical protein